MSNKLHDDDVSPAARDESASNAPADIVSPIVADDDGALPEDLVIPLNRLPRGRLKLYNLKHLENHHARTSTPATSAMIELPAVLDRVEDFTGSELCRIFESLGLSRDQAIFTYLHNLMGYSQREIAALVGWTARHAESIRRTLDRPRARRAIAASGLLAGTAARWPGPQLGGIVTLFFPECPQIARTGLMFGSDARHPLTRRPRSYSFMLKPIKITPAEIAVEVKSFETRNRGLCGYSPEFVAASCADRLRVQAERLAERSELDRLEALTPADASAEFESAQMAMVSTRERVTQLTAEHKKAVADWSATRGQGSPFHDLAAFARSPIGVLESELQQAKAANRAASWSWQALGQIVNYHREQTKLQDLAELVAKYGPDAVKLGVKLNHSAPELAGLRASDPTSSILRDLTRLGGLKVA